MPTGAEGAAAAKPRTVAECVDRPVHAGALTGAARVGEAARGGRLVRIGLFDDGRARFRATTCASLIAYAEVACEAVEAGVPPSALDAGALRARVEGVHPDHLERAALVADAIRALKRGGTRSAEPSACGARAPPIPPLAPGQAHPPAPSLATKEQT